jgi:hypothetical protein
VTAPPPPTRSDRIRSTYLVVLGVIVCVAVGALVALAVTGTASPLGAVVGAIGSAAVGALAAQLAR